MRSLSRRRSRKRRPLSRSRADRYPSGILFHRSGKRNAGKYLRQQISARKAKRPPGFLCDMPEGGRMDGQACLPIHADIRRATDSEQLCCELPGTANGFAVSCTVSRKPDHFSGSKPSKMNSWKSFRHSSSSCRERMVQATGRAWYRSQQIRRDRSFLYFQL